MEFKGLNDKPEKHTTPKSQVSILAKRISYGVCSDSPFRSLPCASTPPSRFAKIINPFEPHLIDRLHLPTFSPTVFAQNSTPKAEQKFKWTIEDISSLKPADIDETTVSQHVCTMDNPEVDSLVQQKIETFFSEKEIVPSPMHIKTDHYVPLIKDCTSSDKQSPLSQVSSSPKTPTVTCEGSTQTVLTLPPVLPKEVEEALKPYFNYHDDDHEEQCNDEEMQNNSLYKQLFEFEHKSSEGASPKTDPANQDAQSLVSSPALSTSLSPIQFSPFARGLESPFDMPELRECNLSPITKNSPKRLSRSRLNFSSTEKMSVDASLIVPDIEGNPMTSRSFVEEEHGFSPLRLNNTTNPDMTVNWSMEYKQITLASSPTSSTDSDKMDVSNSNTPHSKIFVGKGQRKRLSESFKSDDLEVNDNALQYEDVCVKNRFKLFKNDLTDAGYQSQETGDFSNNSTNVFASTPSKRHLVEN